MATLRDGFGGNARCACGPAGQGIMAASTLEIDPKQCGAWLGT